MLPDRLIWKYESENQGVFKIKFSNSGKYIAAACTLATNKTIIKIFDCEDGHLQLIVRGHNDLIHDLCWSFDDRFLVSASADGSVRVWNLSDKETENSDRYNYQDNDRLFFVTEIYHPSFVYGAKIHPRIREEGFLYIASICYDQKVRIWEVTVDDLDYPSYSCKCEMSINDQPDFIFGGNKGTMYDYEDDLEDDTLRLLMNP
jgi:WD40 repeat protein